MRRWVTEIRAISPETGELTLYQGYVEDISPKLAQEYCNMHGLGYMKVTDRYIVQEVDKETGDVLCFESDN